MDYDIPMIQTKLYEMRLEIWNTLLDSLDFQIRMLNTAQAGIYIYVTRETRHKLHTLAANDPKLNSDYI